MSLVGYLKRKLLVYFEYLPLLCDYVDGRLPLIHSGPEFSTRLPGSCLTLRVSRTRPILSANVYKRTPLAKGAFSRVLLIIYFDALLFAS